MSRKGLFHHRLKVVGLCGFQVVRLYGCTVKPHNRITETAVDIRVAIKNALLCNATVIALCHNHPSNNASPSGDDDRLTQRMKKACEVMRLHFLDHLIITDGMYYSYSEMGRL